jgi:hypothetical protein
MAIRQERVGDALKLVIGPRVNWLGLLTAFLLLSILFGVGIAPAWDGLNVALETGRSTVGYILGITALSAIVLFVAYGILLNFFGSELIVVSSTNLEIQSSVFGFTRSQRSFPNSTVENLRYEEWPGARGAGMQHGIRFECVGVTVTFAQNATTANSYEILDQMKQVYLFPSADPPDQESSPAVTHW